MDDGLNWLMAWYFRQCNGHWEHFYGVKVETLDNPGWLLRIALRETPLHGRKFTPVIHRTAAADLEEWQQTGGWWTAKVDGDMFEAACGPLDLNSVIAVFRQWAESSNH